MNLATRSRSAQQRHHRGELVGVPEWESGITASGGHRALHLSMNRKVEGELWENADPPHADRDSRCVSRAVIAVRSDPPDRPAQISSAIEPTSMPPITDKAIVYSLEKTADVSQRSSTPCCANARAVRTMFDVVRESGFGSVFE